MPAVVLFCSVAPLARADPPKNAAPLVPAKSVAVAPKQAPVAPEPRPAPDVKLALSAETTRGPWTMTVTNQGDVPVRIVADARLLSLEALPRGARKPTMCELASDMRPSDDLGRALVLPPKRSYRESFEPRLYCFGPAKIDALTGGTTVVARLGFPPTVAKNKPPFEVSPVDGVKPEIAPVKVLESSPVAVPDEPSAWMVPAPGDSQDLDSYASALSLQGALWVDAQSPLDIAIPITLRNDGTRAVVVRFRPEVLSFDLIGPAEVEHCSWPMVPAAAMREMFTALAPKASATLDVNLNAYCAGHGLDQAGLLVVRPRLDTRKASGAALGLLSFDGELIAMTPTVVRLHHGAASRPLSPPRLEEER